MAVCDGSGSVWQCVAVCDGSVWWQCVAVCGVCAGLFGLIGIGMPGMIVMADSQLAGYLSPEWPVMLRPHADMPWQAFPSYLHCKYCPIHSRVSIRTIYCTVFCRYVHNHGSLSQVGF